MLSLVTCQLEKSVSWLQNSWIVSTTKSRASLGRFFSMSVVSWDIPGALSRLIFILVLLISFFWGVVPRDLITGCCSSLSRIFMSHDLW